MSTLTAYLESHAAPPAATDYEMIGGMRMRVEETRDDDMDDDEGDEVRAPAVGASGRCVGGGGWGGRGPEIGKRLPLRRRGSWVVWLALIVVP